MVTTTSSELAVAAASQADHQQISDHLFLLEILTLLQYLSNLRRLHLRRITARCTCTSPMVFMILSLSLWSKNPIKSVSTSSMLELMSFTNLTIERFAPVCLYFAQPKFTIPLPLKKTCSMMLSSVLWSTLTIAQYQSLQYSMPSINSKIYQEEDMLFIHTSIDFSQLQSPMILQPMKWIAYRRSYFVISMSSQQCNKWKVIQQYDLWYIIWNWN